jgi:hypothetical protein
MLDSSAMARLSTDVGRIETEDNKEGISRTVSSQNALYVRSESTVIVFVLGGLLCVMYIVTQLLVFLCCENLGLTIHTCQKKSGNSLCSSYTQKELQ